MSKCTPSSESEETRRSVMIIPESCSRDLGNSAKRRACHISLNHSFMRDKGVVGGHLSIVYKRRP
jgi:hypothetical protein